MEIDKKIEEVQSRLTKILTENDLNNSAVVEKLESLGLDIDTVTNLIEAYKNAESAKNTAKGAWETALDSRVESDSTTDIAQSQQQEFDARQQFDKAAFKCALLIVAKIQRPDKINDEILAKLYENGIQEEQIDNSELKTAYHYYCVGFAKERDKREKDERDEREKRIELSEKVKSGVMILEQKIKDLQSQNKDLQSQNEVLDKSYKNLQNRIGEGEQRYQQALSLIRELKRSINQLQSRGIFQTIGDKILGRNIIKQLPRSTTELPKTLYENKAEEIGIIGMPGINKDTLKMTSPNTQTSSNNQAKKEDEMQK